MLIPFIPLLLYYAVLLRNHFLGQCRDIIHLLCSHLELFQATKAKIEKQQSRSLSTEEQDKELKFVLSAENKLHPSLFSAEAEHKVYSLIPKSPGIAPSILLVISVGACLMLP